MKKNLFYSGYNEEPFILNPNCSEVVWRIKGHSQKYEGTNQEPFAVFITQILEVFANLGLSKEKILSAEPIYIRGDGGPDTLEWSFKYAQDIVAGDRDPHELEFEEELDDQIVERGYDAEISKNWKPIVKTPRTPNDPLTYAEKLTNQIKQNAQLKQSPVKKSERVSPSIKKNTKQKTKKKIWTLVRANDL